MGSRRATQRDEVDEARETHRWEVRAIPGVRRVCCTIVGCGM